jgi:predicted HTH transcriptional regulator
MKKINNRMKERVLKFVKKEGATTPGELSSKFKISKRQVNYILRELIEKGKIKRIGELYVAKRNSC